MNQVVNIAAYKFVPLDRLKERRLNLRKLSRSLGLKGTILLSREGINLFVAGPGPAIGQLLESLRSQPSLSDLEVKLSHSDKQPFRRMLVKIKREIISFAGEVDLSLGQKISPRELKQWLDDGRKVTLLDVRNDFEVRLGSFRNSLNLHLGHFHDFPYEVGRLPEQFKQHPIVMFCTGGIRCEKAGPWMQQQGFGQVLQLEGGILKYFEECGADHYDGECFVFDQRVALDRDLQETDTTQCFACLEPLTVEDQRSHQYVPGQSCPYCYQTPAETREKSIQKRAAALRKITRPLPGSVPYNNLRPMNVPGRFNGMTVLEFLATYHSHISRQLWLRECQEGRIIQSGTPVSEDRRVLAGERLSRLIPAVMEPPVNPDIGILHEDAALVVVNKPAPLPIHPCGRFNRNSLSYILRQVYYPERLRPAHRLDANTSGVLVLSRTRHIAARVQRQFEQGAVTKIYLARVIGTPPESFECDAPIGREAEAAGGRIIDAGGLAARTNFTVLERFSDGTSLIEARSQTWRTNQIRIHLWILGWPLVGDPLYRKEGTCGNTQTLLPTDPPLCLHAFQIEFQHPLSGKRSTFQAPSPRWVGEQVDE